MTVRFLVVAIDDERPLGPQMCAALRVLSWETVRELTGNAFSLRWLRHLVETSEISERQTVRVGCILRPHAKPERGDEMAALFDPGKPLNNSYVPAPTPPVQDNSAQLEAARKERLADSKAVGRGATILTDYATALQTPTTLKPTLGA